MASLDDYQIEIVNKVAEKVRDSFKKIVMSLPTGAGKSVCFASLCDRWGKANPEKSILILVHRSELLDQARRTLHEWYQINSEPVIAKNKTIESSKVYVGMIETVNNRLKKNGKYFRNVGMVIIDEAHLGSFTKIHDYFKDDIIVGVTATAISASKRHPLKELYETICVGVDIPYLIGLHERNPARGLVPCVTYGPPNVDKSKLHTRAGEYDQGEMAEEYSKNKHVQNTVDKYLLHAAGKKTLVFNVNISHSILVCQAFVDAGLPCKHLDSEGESDERKEILKWFKETPGAILCNIGILTTGFDEPSVECIIPNKSTKSLPLWLQMCGRGSRPYPGKKFFIIIDMGDNVSEFMEWSEPRDWETIFMFPDKPITKSAGVAGIKICIKCEGIIPIQAIKCKHCGAMQPIKEPTYDGILGEFILITKNIDVTALITANKTMVRSDGQPMNPYRVLHKLKNEIIDGIPKTKKLNDAQVYALLGAYNAKVQEWCKEVKKPYNVFHREAPAEWFFEAIKEKYGWIPPNLSI